MKISEVTRRGFLKGLAGAAAQTAIPGGVANLVKAAPVAAAPVVSAASAAELLFKTALNIGAKHGFGKSDSMWDDEEDNEENEWNKELEEPQGEFGEMPWGEYYEVGETPNGVPYLHTSDSPDGNYGVFTFMDNGKPQYIVIAWERGGFGEVDSASDPKYIDRYNNGSNDWEGEPSEMIDIVMDPANDAATADDTADTTELSRIARLAGLAKSGFDKLSNTNTKEPEAAPAAPLQLPAPTDDNVLKPNLNQHEKVPVSKHKK